MFDRRHGAVGGLVFAACSAVAGALLPKPPDSDASAARFHAYFTDHRSAIVTVCVFSAVGALALLPFLAAVRERLRGLAADTFYAGGVVLVALGVLGALLQSAVAQESARIEGPALLAAASLEQMVFFAGPPIAVVVVLGAVALSFRDGLLPAWLCAFAGLVAVLGAVGAVAQILSDTSPVAAIGFGGFILTVVWIAVAAVVTLRGPGQSAARVGSPATAT
jgi:hypothetical protein